jgi:diguanylate cyclase
VVSAPRGAWLSVLAAGCATVGLAWYLPDGPAAAVWICTQLVGLAIVTGALTRRAAIHRSGWWLLLTSSGLGVASGALYLIPAGDRSEWAWMVALAPRYALLIVGLVLLLGFHRAQTTEQVFLDAGIVSAGLAIVGWTFLAEPSLSRPAASPHPGAWFAYLALDLLMLACLVRIMLSGRSRTPTMLLLAAAGGVMVAASVASTLLLPGDGLAEYQPGGLVHLASQLSGVLVAAAALHPSFSAGYAPPAADDPAAGGQVPLLRFVVFVAVALVAPVVPMLGLLYADRNVPADILPALAGSTALTAVLVVLLVVRLGLVARLAGRRARAMKVQAAALMVQATALQRALDDQQVLQRELAHRAQHDPLTGLANRSLLLERLEQALADGARRNRPRPTPSAHAFNPAGTLLLLDLDGFKEVNNTLGHPAGDELLVQVADRLRMAAGEACTVARLGGDEFAVLMAGTDVGRGAKADGRVFGRGATSDGDFMDGCWQVADRVVAALRPPFPLGERLVHLAASGGLLPLDPSRPCPIATLRDADLALYAAKQAGKNQVVEFRPQMREARLRYSQLAASIRSALSGDGLTVLYQPIVDLASGRPVALEALVRWRAPDGRHFAPDEFLSVAEALGLAGDIGARVLRDACRQASAWHQRYDVALSVNVHGQQLGMPGFVDGVLAVLDETALPAPALILEVTEPVLASGQAHECLDPLRRHGVRVAADGFGTGHSALSYLHRLPLDMLKLDRAITAALDSAGGPGAGFVGAIVGLGAGLGVPTVGGGVESSRQAELLRELACPMAQGYHFSAPAPADQVTAYLGAATTPVASGSAR